MLPLLVSSGISATCAINAVVSSQTILNINKGKEIMPATVGKIAAALGVDVTEIIEDEG